jgi:alpha-ketoglutarate-dependent taurine dioxygenase
MSFAIRPLSDALGAEVLGLDVSRPLEESVFARVHKAHLDHHVLVFRDQRLTPRQQIDFSRRFGPLDAHPSQDDAHLPDFPEILVVSTKRKNGKDVGVRNAGPMWHSDLAYREKPALGSMLYAVELPDSGGDTGFANMIAAYETLPRRLKDAVGDRRALFLSTRNPSLFAHHPVFRTHPESGRKSIFVNPQLTKGIDGIEAAESAALLAEIYDHCRNPDFIYRHKWRPGDLVFWDNRCVLHIADLGRVGDPAYIRHMHRTTIQGEAAF